MITENDIKNSLERLQNGFEGRYGDFPIREDERTVGMLTLDQSARKIYVTFRGSVDSLFEIFSCLFIWKKDVPELKGKVHAGIYTAYQKTVRSFQASLQRIRHQNSVDLKDYEFIVEGYSRGSGLAALTAFFLKMSYPQNKLSVMTYSTIRLLDQDAARTYNEMLGTDHFSFNCKEDLFPQKIGPARLGYSPIGQIIDFSASQGERYNERVRQRVYTYLLDVPVIAWLIKKVISAAHWEAHMPQTYAESAPRSFRSLT